MKGGKWAISMYHTLESEHFLGYGRYVESESKFLNSSVKSQQKSKYFLGKTRVSRGCHFIKKQILKISCYSPYNAGGQCWTYCSGLIVDLGFEIKTEVVFLGANISKLRGFVLNASIREKVRKQINFLTNFTLSLPGRISTAKTFLQSKINYLVCFLLLNQNTI